jgi:hypothetical protein
MRINFWTWSVAGFSLSIILFVLGLRFAAQGEYFIAGFDFFAAFVNLVSGIASIVTYLNQE